MIWSLKPKPLTLIFVSDYMTTDEAFKKMIHTRGIHNELGVSQKLVSVYRQHLKNGRTITLDQKFELLEKAGYHLIQEPQWRKGLVNKSSVKFKDLGAQLGEFVKK